MDEDRNQKFQRGLAMLDRVYGPGTSQMFISLRDSPGPADTVEHLFGEIWGRPHLSIRDRRLLVIGATAMLGRADLIEQQIAGALQNGELDPAQLEEAALHLTYYVGAGNGVALFRGIKAALDKHAKKPGDPA